MPAFANVQLPLNPVWRTSGLPEQVTPLIDLKAIWCTMLSLFVNWTVSPWAIVTDFGTNPSLEIVTATVFAAAGPDAATSATTTKAESPCASTFSLLGGNATS